MKTLVTGGAGFIGSHIVDALVARGHEVMCIDSLDPGVHRGVPGYLRKDVEYCFVDLRYWRPDQRFADVEAIVHLAALGGVARAARELGNIVTANCGGTARLVDTARELKHLKHVVLAGSFSVYGAGYTYQCQSCMALRTGQREARDLEAGRFEVLCHRCGGQSAVLPITEAAEARPLEAYGASKYMQELCFRGFDHAPVTIMRFSSVYGPRLRLDDGEATIIARIAGWIQAGSAPTLLEDGKQVRDWVFVGDLVDAVLAVLAGAAAPPVLNICSGVPTTLREACEYIARAVGSNITPRVIGGFRPGDMRHCLGDATKFAAIIGRQPLPFRHGAPRTFDHSELLCAASL